MSDIGLGCIFSINPDANSTAELDLMRWALAMARKGGISADRVLNALDLRGFSHWLEERSIRSAPTRPGYRRGAGIARTHPNSARE